MNITGVNTPGANGYGRISLGLDSSTQSLTAAAVDIDGGRIVYEKSLSYVRDPRLSGYGLDHDLMIIPPRVPGEADQPPLLFLASLDALFQDMKSDGFPMEKIALINVSGQQHGHLYLNETSRKLFASLRNRESASSSLKNLLGDSFSYLTAPIWKTSDTSVEADAIRAEAGGKAEMIRLSGSDSPLRFTGAVIRRVGSRYPEAYEKTVRIQLVSSFFPAVLTGNIDVPIDFGNGCGMSLMNYTGKRWDPLLVSAAADGLPGSGEGLLKKLPGLTAPDAPVGKIAAYFTEKYGLSGSCVIAAGSGDNPQTKVLIRGDLLSLGTSFVNMVSSDGKTMDFDGYANAMYDGLGRPFLFGCRTNGALVWDRVRGLHGLKSDEFAPADGSLGNTPVGEHIVLWQPDNESFPASASFPVYRERGSGGDLPSDYAGIIEGTLAIMYHYSKPFAGAVDTSSEPLHVTGGPAYVDQVIRRIAAVWNRPVVTIGKVGAALGAAVAGAGCLSMAAGEPFTPEELSAAVLPRTSPVHPDPADAAVFHGPGKYIQRVVRRYEELIHR